MLIRKGNDEGIKKSYKVNVNLNCYWNSSIITNGNTSSKFIFSGVVIMIEESVYGYLIMLGIVICVWVYQEYTQHKKQFKIERYRRRFN